MCSSAAREARGEISSAECEMKKVCRDKAERERGRESLDAAAASAVSMCRLCDPIFRDQTRSLFPSLQSEIFAGDEVLWTIYCLGTGNNTAPIRVQLGSSLKIVYKILSEQNVSVGLSASRSQKTLFPGPADYSLGHHSAAIIRVSSEGNFYAPDVEGGREEREKQHIFHFPFSTWAFLQI